MAANYFRAPALCSNAHLVDARRSSPSTARNRERILAVLAQHFPERARVLEIASGAGEHAVFFARALPGLTWQPSEPDEASRESIAAWIAHEKLANVLAPIAIDVTALDWPVAGPFDALVAINMIHISPWAATEGLMRGAGALLAPGGVLFVYGPYKRDGAHTAPSNEAFDATLRTRNPEWGVRDLEQVVAAANANGLALREAVEMPANNLSVIFAKT
jgi:cyclopropane fatty-acyl-phospholipid synthase-like methyltransferase